MPEEGIAGFVENVLRHLAPRRDRLMASIATYEDIVNGVALHQTMHMKPWWIRTFGEPGNGGHQPEVEHVFRLRHAPGRADRRLVHDRPDQGPEARRRADGHEARLLRGPGPEEGRRDRRHQEGLSADGPEEPPRPQPRRRRGRGAGSRRRPRRTRSSPTSRSASDTTDTATPGSKGPAHHDFRNTEDIMSAFGDIFGGGLFGDLFQQRKRGPRPGQDLLMKLEIDLIEAARGTTKVVDVTRQEPCGECKGSGARKGTVATTCNYCGGPGPGRPVPRVLPGRHHLPGLRRRGRPDQRPLPDLQGPGQDPGRGPHQDRRAARRRDRDVAPAPEPGRGRRPGRPPGQPPGPDPGPQAPVLRAEPQRPGLPGPDQLPPGRARRRDRGPHARRARPPDGPQGDPERRRPQAQGPGDARHQRPGARRRAGRGQVETPRHLTPRQEELLRELAEIEHLDVSPKRKSFFEKLRDYFTEDEEGGEAGHSPEAARPERPSRARPDPRSNARIEEP